MSRPGGDLALLLLAGFRVMADRGTTELAARGYDDVRPMHDFALHAILSGADNASELGRRMSVTKQAAAKVVAVLEQRGYVGRESDPSDGRRKHLFVTERGTALLQEGERVFDELRVEWERLVGTGRVAELEQTLAMLVGDQTIRLDAPGWSVEAGS